jgi:flagellar hook assembly protein FlgD
MGAAIKVDTLAIRWPSGIERIIIGVGFNQQITMVEGTAASVAGSPIAPTLSTPMIPNPFSTSTRLTFTLPRSHSDTSVGVYNSHGRLVRTLVRGLLPAGPHEVVWDGRDYLGQAMPSGQYFYELRLEGAVLTSGKVLLIK